MRMRALVRLFGFATLLCSVPATAESLPELVGQWRYATTRAVAEAGDMAVFGSGTVLMVADVSDMTAPAELGSIAFDGMVNDIAVVDGFAFVAADEAGLRIVDLSNPASPAEVASVDNLWRADAISCSGGHAFVASRTAWGDAWLFVVDVTNPTEPLRVGSLELPMDTIRDLAVEGSVVYLANREGFFVVDVGAPSSPEIIGKLAGLDGSGVTTYLDFAIMVGLLQLNIIDVSDPSTPVVVGTLALPNFTYWIASHGPLVVVGTDEKAMLVSIENPAHPVQLTIIDTLGLPTDAHVTGTRLLLADWSSLRLFDVSEPSQPVETGMVATAGPSVFAEVAGSIAYISTMFGFHVLDISDPASPRRVGRYQWEWVTRGGSGGFDLEGDRVYLARGSRLEVIDVSDPSELTVMGAVDLQLSGPCSAGPVTEVEGVVHVACEDWNRGISRWYAIDVSDPTAPTVVGQFNWPGGDMAVFGDVAYLAGGSLRVIDVSNPAAPVQLDEIELLASAVAVEDQRLYVATLFNAQTQSPGALHVFDISEPASPSEIGMLVWSVDATAIAVASGFAYWVSPYSGLEVFDVTDPTTIQPLGWFHLGPHRFPDEARDVAVGNGLVVAAYGDFGVTVHYEHGASFLFSDDFESGDTGAWSGSSS